MRVLISPNAFKNSLTAEAAANAIEAGLNDSKSKFDIEKFPVADGGDGTGALLMKRMDAARIDVRVNDPLGQIITSFYGLTSNGTAIIEMANASGLRLLKPDDYDPLHSNSFGTGQLMKAAIDAGARKIILGVGGSATVDGGLGALASLGLVVKDSHGRKADFWPADFESWQQIDIEALDILRKKIHIDILCDVQNPLLGENGAAAVFGPQKGAKPGMIPLLESSLSRLRDLVMDRKGVDAARFARGGAAGGIAAFFHVLLDAKLVNGIDFFLDHTHYNEALAVADWVITGEGKMDRQTLEGKAPMGVAVRAFDSGVKVLALAGEVENPEGKEWKPYFTELRAINNPGESLSEAMEHTGRNLTLAARHWALTQGRRD